MTDDRPINTSIEPADFIAPGEGGNAHRSTHSVSVANDMPSTDFLRPKVIKRWWHSQFNLMLFVFALLATSALLFIWLTPSPDSNQFIVPVSQDKFESSNAAQADKPQNTDKPFNESLQQQARTDAQDALADLLDVKKYLEQKQVESWAQKDYAAALLIAARGDESYSSNNYARSHYTI